MVQNKNWQKRIEMANERKKISKIKKQLNNEKRINKLHIQELLQLLDRNICTNNNNNNNNNIIIWTDTLPQPQQKQKQKVVEKSASFTEEDEEEEEKIEETSSSNDVLVPGSPNISSGTKKSCNNKDNNKKKSNKKKKQRSISLGNESDQLLTSSPMAGQQQQQRNRSNSFGKHRIHPRSKQKQQQEPSSPLLLSSSPKSRVKLSSSSSSLPLSPLLLSSSSSLPMSPFKLESDDCLLHSNDVTTTTTTTNTFLLCRSHFFHGKCSSSLTNNNNKQKNINKCRYVHYSNNNNNNNLDNDKDNNDNTFISLCQAISTNTNKHKTLEKAEKALILRQQQNDNNLDYDNSNNNDYNYYNTNNACMEPIFSLYVNVPNSSSNNNNNNNNTSISEIITKTLIDNNLISSNIVYVVCNGILIYDRNEMKNNNGTSSSILYPTDREFINAVMSNSNNSNNNITYTRRESSFGSEVEIDENIIHLPGTILECILTYLPDTAVAITSSVCSAWYTEITSSNNLWKFLLQRNNWPIHNSNNYNNNNTSIDDLEDSSSTTTLISYREQFIKHYTVLRDIRALKAGLNAITTTTTMATTRSTNSNSNKTDSLSSLSVVGTEMAYQDFSTMKHSPTQPNCCIGMYEWSPNRILSAYHNDCTLRLYESCRSNSNNRRSSSCSSNEIFCRELICQKIDPYQNTKRRNCTIVSVGLDEEFVGTLCSVTINDNNNNNNGGINNNDITINNNNNKSQAYVLIVMTRDDFLLGESSAAAEIYGSKKKNYKNDLSHLTIIDVGEAVLYYLLSMDEYDHRLLHLTDFLSNGGDLGQVEVLLSHTLAACGYGRFMIEATISIPLFDEDDMEYHLQMIDRKLFLFSASANAIVWMGESNPLMEELRPRNQEMSLSYLRRPQTVGGSRASCVFAVASLSSPTIMVGEIDPSGVVQPVQALPASRMVREDIIDEDDEWEISTTRSHDCIRSIVVTSSDVIAADLVVKQANDLIQERKSILSFYPRQKVVEGEDDDTVPIYSTLVLNDVEVIRMIVIRDDHIAVLGRVYPSIESTTMANRRQQDNNNNNNDSNNTTVVAIIVDIAGRKEIGRVNLLDRQAEDSIIPSMANDGSGTIGLGLSWEGIVMTGSDIRSVVSSVDVTNNLDGSTQSKSVKKKKKRSLQRGSKKDGFIRGMTLTG